MEKNNLGDHVIDYKEFLTTQYNIWREELTQRTAAWKQAELEKQRDPATTFKNPQGQSFSILDVIESRKGLVREAKQYVMAIGQLLETPESEELENVWSDEDLKPLPKFEIPTKK